MSTECECERFPGRLNEICNGTVEGVPEGYVNWWRESHGMHPIGQTQEEWNVTKKSRGLGDLVAKFTHYTGITTVVNAVATAAGVPCGCGERQEALNKAVPFK